MPPLETSDLNQWAVLWAFLRFDEFGAPVTDDPTEIRVRWETNKLQTFDASGNPILLDAKVVSRSLLTINDQLWLGKLADWYTEGSAGHDDEVVYVRTDETTPDIKARNTRYTYGLSRHMDRGP